MTGSDTPDESDDRDRRELELLAGLRAVWDGGRQHADPFDALDDDEGGR